MGADIGQVRPDFESPGQAVHRWRGEANTARPTSKSFDTALHLAASPQALAERRERDKKKKDRARAVDKRKQSAHKNQPAPRPERQQSAGGTKKGCHRKATTQRQFSGTNYPRQRINRREQGTLFSPSPFGHRRRRRRPPPPRPPCRRTPPYPAPPDGRKRGARKKKTSATTKRRTILRY